MSFKNLLIGFLFISSHLLSGQDLLFDIKVDASTANSSETRVFLNMETAFEQFLNERKWHEAELEPFEKIKGVMAINILSVPRTNQYEAKMQVQSVRPVFNSTYESIMWNVPDSKFNFDYTESQPLDYAPNSFNTHLVSILAYYANLIVGLDMDSYSPLGGQSYLQEAFNIAQAAQQQGLGAGWEQFANIDSRFAIIRSIMNSQLESVRQANYTYHRLGLDLIAEQPDEARENILKALIDIQKANKLNANEPFIVLFMQTKVDEIINIFTEGDLQVRRQVYNLMREIAPANSDRYEVMIK